MGQMRDEVERDDIGKILDSVYNGSAVPGQDQYYLDSNILPSSFRRESSIISNDIVAYICRRESAEPPPTSTAKVMRSLVDDLLQDRLEMMRELVIRLNITGSEQLHLLNNIATNMFDDQVVTWGRIVTLHGFCSYLARYCQENEIPDCRAAITDILQGIIINRLGLWIITNGGWASFEQQFPAVDMFDSGGFWKVLLVFGLIITIAAISYSFLFVGSSGK